MDNHLINLYTQKRIDYSQVKKNCEFYLKDINPVDVSIIIPVMNRESFHAPLVKHLKDAIIKHSEKSYSITFVEHSDTPKHKLLCEESNTNYIWIKKSATEPFNKCLAMNVGSLYSNSSKYYLFHDIDLLMTPAYFIDIFKNLNRVHNECALQTFAYRRILVMDQAMSDQIINGVVLIDSLTPGINPPHSNPGAPGGSIFINANSFKAVGGYDAEFFHSYSPEDAFFFHKLQLVTGIEGCNDPVIEAYHMYHAYMGGSNPEKPKMEEIWSEFRNMQSSNKLEFINHIAAEFKKL